jgi:hypothetical protein
VQTLVAQIVPYVSELLEHAHQGTICRYTSIHKCWKEKENSRKITPLCYSPKVFSCFWHYICKELHFYSPRVLTADGHIEEHLRHNFGELKPMRLEDITAGRSRSPLTNACNVTYFSKKKGGMFFKRTVLSLSIACGQANKYFKTTI